MLRVLHMSGRDDRVLAGQERYRVARLKMMLERGLCPICGESTSLTGSTTDGRLIGACGDAFTVAQWARP